MLLMINIINIIVHTIILNNNIVVIIIGTYPAEMIT